MAKEKKKEALSLEEKLQQMLVPTDEQPYEVPENWCWTKVGSVCVFENGYAFKADKFSEEGTIPVIRISNIQQNEVDLDSCVYTTETEVDSRFLVKYGDLLIAMSGATTGKNGVFLSNVPAFVNQRVGNIKVRNEKILLPAYRNYYIMAMEEEILRGAYGGAQPNISSNKICNMNMPLAPIAEQQRITERVESMFVKLDEAKSQLEVALEETEVRKTAILHNAFKGELTKSWREEHKSYKNTVIEAVRLYSDTLSNKDKKFIAEGQAELNPIEMSGNIVWYETKIGAISRVTNGSTPSRQCKQYWNGDIPWVSSGEVRNNIIDITEERITQEGYDSSSVKLLPKGTVLIAMIGEGKTRGQSAVLNIEATINQNIAAIVIEHGQINSKFLWYWLQKEYKKNREKGAGSGPQALNCQRVRELDMIVPPIEEQDAIVEIIDGLMQKEMQVIETINETIDKILLIKKSVLAKAFRGELGTNNLDEESAVELLKRVLK